MRGYGCAITVKLGRFHGASSAGAQRVAQPATADRQSASPTPPTQARPAAPPPPDSTCTRMSDKPLTDIAFSSFDLHPALLAGLEAAGFSRCTPDPGADPADHARRPRRRRPGADRHRQDPRVPDHGREPPADPPGAGRPQARGSARADPGADARARDPDPQGRGEVRRRPRPEVRAGLRRRRLRQAAPAAAGRRRRHHRHARPPDRLRQAAQGGLAARLRGVRARRSRPHVRPGLHQGHPLPAAPHAGAHRAADAAVLGDAVAPRARARLRAHERAGEDRRSKPSSSPTRACAS